jgi:hypothetical protein
MRGLGAMPNEDRETERLGPASGRPPQENARNAAEHPQSPRAEPGPPTASPSPPSPPTVTLPAPPTASPDRLIADRYLLRAELGRGGMGVVWRGEDRVIGRADAVKEMRLSVAVSPAERAEFETRILREARTAGRLNDPAVVTVFDVVHDNGSVFIVMELVEAPTLAQLIRGSGPLSPSVVARTGLQVLAALEAAHAAGIVHRDVKPSNIMMPPNGRAKLTDFGIAQAADDPTLTKTGMVVGSPAYLAPERLGGHEATPASDIWSLGAVLFFAVEGRGAFERDTTAATLSAVIHEVPYLTRAQGPLAAAISGMLVAAPEGRLAGAQLHALLTSVAQLPDGTSSPDGSPQTRLMPGSAQGSTVFFDGARPAGGPPLPAARRRLSPGMVAGAVFGTLVLAGGLFGVGMAIGASKGKAAQQTADLPGYADVQLFSYGLPGEKDTLLYTLSSYDSCGSGSVPMKTGITYANYVDCKKPHDFEKFAEFSLGDDHTPYPDVDRLKDAAQAGCYAAASRARPIANADIAALIPSRRLWEGDNLPDGFRADRNVICVAWVSGGQISPVPTSSSSGG